MLTRNSRRLRVSAERFLMGSALNSWRDWSRNGRRLCWLRLIGVSGFLVLTAVLGAVGDPRWHADLGLLAVYWAIAVALLIWQSRAARHRLNGFDIALVDMPLAFLIQWSLFVGGPNDRGTAGFSIGLYVLLVAT